MTMSDRETPDQIKQHDSKYQDSGDAWKKYTVEELQWWVHLLRKRAAMRVVEDVDKIKKDRDDADNYEAMLKTVQGLVKRDDV
jgi:hypothetical protein